MSNRSLAEEFADAPYARREEMLEDVYVSSAGEFLYDPEWWLRPDQLTALHSKAWIIGMLAGRGAGKTRTLSEWVKEKAKTPNTRIALVARTSADVRDTMIQGESGILAVHSPSSMPEHIPSTRRLVWPNGSIAITFSAEEPSQLRGPQFHYTACLPAETLVLTDRGQVPIQDVATSDWVWTRAGWRPVRWSGPTRPDAQLVELTFEDGRTLRCTPDHRIWDTNSKQWRCAENMLGASVLSCRSSGSLALSGVASVGTRVGRTGTTAIDKGVFSTSPCIEPTTARSLTDSSSITSMRTRAITNRTTSKPSLRTTTTAFTLADSSRTPPRNARRSPSGCGANGRGVDSHAPSVVARSTPRGCEPSSVMSGVETRTMRVVTIRRVPGREQTYDLTVDGCPEFVADGILVHNCDELAAWKMKPDNSGVHAWDNVKISTRLGSKPQIFVATTPKRTPEIRQIVEDAKAHPQRFHLFRGSTADNKTNLSFTYLETILGMYRGTSIERQELYGELLDEVEGALWTMELIELSRRRRRQLGDLLGQWRIVGVDPSVAEKPGDECGIVVIASTNERLPFQRRASVLEDYSLRASPDVWAKEAVKAAREWDAIIVAEKNQGGQLVEMAIKQQDQSVPVVLVTATKGKAIRAEPIVMAYEQGRVSHTGRYPELEDEMTGWVPGESGYSPNRMDALVWALTGALVDDKKLKNALTRIRASAAQVERTIGPAPSWRRPTPAQTPSWRRR